jgi:[Skp1-protein]-hydroxyproline N-acetylglucosaminyltransferase
LLSRGGENYYVQVDSHLQFARRWDELYIHDLQLARSYPKAVLSTYPPGFVNFRQEAPFTPGTRICRCRFSHGEGNIVRVEMNGRCKESEPRPTQMPFVGAGFIFAHGQVSTRNAYCWVKQEDSRPALTTRQKNTHLTHPTCWQLLRDVPYDPYLPWCFMGEEIAFSMRAWTNGWNIYAPRVNLVRSNQSIRCVFLYVCGQYKYSLTDIFWTLILPF